MEEWRELYREIEETLEEKFTALRRTVVKNLDHLVIALIIVLRTPRGWYGKLSLSGISRGMCTDGKAKSRYKRLHRFLDNPHFQSEQLSSGLLQLVVGEKIPSLLPLIVDQTAIGDIQVITGSYPVEGRSVPLAMATFEYRELKRSQNALEEDFLTKLSESIPKKTQVVWIMDRGYGRAALLVFCRKQKWLYIIRGRSNVKVQYQEQGKLKRMSLGRLKHRQGVACRYRNVLYHGIIKEKVDVIVYRERGFKEPWFLLVPPDTEDLLPTELVVSWYRARMRIEVSFRDFKSWLGVRSLRLKVRRTQRLGHLLAALAIGYILLLALGGSRLGKQLRRELEILRKRARHGTRRTLSVLSIALMTVTDYFLLNRTNLMSVLADCLMRMRQGQIFMSPLSG